MNSERQNTISHALVIESWRTSRPPVDQQMAATIIRTRRADGGGVGEERRQVMGAQSKAPASHGRITGAADEARLR